MSTQHEQTTRDQEVGRLESEIIHAWVYSGGKLPQDALRALLVSAKLACEPAPPGDVEASATRALERLRRAAEAVKP